MSDLQIFRAKQIIEDQHPLSQISLDDAFPFLKPLMNKFYVSFNALKNPKSGENQIDQILLSKQLIIEEPLTKQTDELLIKQDEHTYIQDLKERLRVSGYHRKNAQNFQDPYIQYGYGVVAFFNLLRVLIQIFVALSFFSLPNIIFYYKNEVISNYYGLAQTTLGNLGSARAVCFEGRLQHDKLDITCNSQVIGEIVYSGILPNIEGTDQNQCYFRDPSTQDQCYDLYKDDLIKELKTSCLGYSQCNIKQFRDRFYKNGKVKECYDDEAIFIVQVKCHTKSEELKNMKVQGLVGVCLGIFMCFIYIFVIYFQYKANDLDFILWDLETVTINDYTVDLKMNQKLKSEYFEYCKQKKHSINENEQVTYHQHFSSFLEADIKQYAIKQNRQDLVTNKKLKVMMLEYDFQRSQLINLMIERGNHIKNLDFKKRRQVEAKINKYMLRNKQQVEDPQRIFVTFEYTEGHNLFIQMIRDKTQEKAKSFQDLKAESAPSPSNIIWQQRNQTRLQIITKRVLSLIFIFVILAGTMVGVFYIRRWGSFGVQPFKNQNCAWIWQQYGDSLSIYAKSAFDDQDYYFESVFNQKVDKQDLNLITCFCIQHDSSMFYSKFKTKYSLEPNEILHNMDEDQSKMCDTFRKNYVIAEVVNQFSSFSIVFLNFILREIIILTVKYIGFETETQQTSKILIYVFLVQFINTDLIILLMNADLSQTFPWIQSFNSGVHPDFTVYWYKDIGLILINTMLFNVYWPVLEFFGFFTKRFLIRQFDRGFSLSSWKTREKTIQKYVDSYSGPEYTIHYKYSAILNITFITFMFGAGMPILFPIALISFITLYVMERLQVAYSYKQPPMFDEKLNKLTIKILLFAPLLYCTVGYWMFNNVQIFTTEVLPIQSQNDNIQTDHSIFKALKFNFASPLLFITVLFLFLAATRRWTMIIVTKFLDLDPKVYMFKPEEQVSFIQALNEQQRTWIIKEEIQARKKFGIKKLSDEFLQKLQNTYQNKNTEMLGIMTYQILDNPIYQKLFQYVPEVLDNRDKYIFDDWVFNSLGQSDYVKKNINTFYIQKNQ